MLLLELALALLMGTLVLTTARLFTNWSDFLRPMSVITILALVSSAMLRRIRWLPAWAANIVSLGIAVVTITVVVLPDTAIGPFPSSKTWPAATHSIQVAFENFRQIIAPVDLRPGFLLIASVVVWLIVIFADYATMRAWAPLQACVVPTAAFVVVSVLTRGSGAGWAGTVFGAALATFGWANRIRRLVAEGWTGGDRTRGAISLAATGLAFVVLAAAVTAGFAAFGPNMRGRAIVDLRSLGTRGGPRVIASPLVGVESLLGTQSNAKLFTVRAEKPHYWRLTSLESFDGSTWSSNATYTDLNNDRVPVTTPPSVKAVAEKQEIRIGEFESAWLPAAFAPQAVDSRTPLQYDRNSGSLFLSDSDDSLVNTTHRVTSVVPTLGDEVFDVKWSEVARQSTFLELPKDFSLDVTLQARSIAGSGGPASAALALQQFFRGGSFVYDQSANYRGLPDPIASFLLTRRGFCQQFATTFAAMARAIGLPARVAVGFTFGDPGPPTEGSDVITWTVRGKHAHAWPEVWLGKLGWVAFEPTPGRGNPDTSEFSGVPADQDGASTPTTTTTTTTAPGATATTTSAAPQRATTTPTTTAVANPKGSGASALPVWPLALLAGLAVLATIVAVRVRGVRNQRTRTDGSPNERIARSWAAAGSILKWRGVVAQGGETPSAFASRAAESIGLADLADLGTCESDRRYRDTECSAEEAARAEAVATATFTEVRSQLTRRQRAAVALGLRARRHN
jgi:transglutaminase-like putative cysteine protease